MVRRDALPGVCAERLAFRTRQGIVDVACCVKRRTLSRKVQEFGESAHLEKSVASLREAESKLSLGNDAAGSTSPFRWCHFEKGRIAGVYRNEARSEICLSAGMDGVSQEDVFISSQSSSSTFIQHDH